MSKRRTLIKQGALATITMAFSILIAEIVVRSLGINPWQHRLERYDFDPTLGWRNRRAFTTFISRSEYAHFVHYDAEGLPTSVDRVNTSLHDAEAAIAIVGDSFVEGYYLPYEDSVACMLERSVSRPVLNFGVSGYSPGQYLLYARECFPDYAITDVVVFFFAYNDIPCVDDDTYQGYAKPLFDDPSGDPVNLPLKKLRGDGPRKPLGQRMLDGLALWALAKPAVARVLTPPENVLAPREFTREEMERALRLIAQIHKEFEEPRFFVYYVPALAEIQNPEALSHNVALYTRICQELAITGLTPDPFLAEGADPKELYWPRDRHFSAEGVRLLVEQLKPVLSAPQLPATSTSAPAGTHTRSDSGQT